MSKHTAKINWQNTGLAFQGAIDGRDDQSLKLGWSDEDKQFGISPMGLVVGGLAGCTGMDVISILKKKRQNVSFFEVEVEGLQVEDHPRTYSDITIVYRFKGEELSEKAIERAIELSVTRYCPVHAMLHDVADIKTRYEILED